MALMAFPGRRNRKCHLRVLRRHFGFGVNFMVMKKARGRQGEGKRKERGRQREGKGFHPRLPTSCLLALMVFLAQKPEMLLARLSASFWYGRPFHGVE